MNQPIDSVETKGGALRETVFCGGVKGAFDHPRVALLLIEGEDVFCPYCGQEFSFTKNKPLSNSRKKIL